MIWLCMFISLLLSGAAHEIVLVEDTMHSPRDVFVDFTITTHAPQLTSISDEDLAQVIVDGFLTQSSHKLSPIVKTILIERIKREQEEVKVTLSRIAQSHTPLSQSSDPVGVKLAEIFSDAMEEALDVHEKKSEEAEERLKERCTRTTTILLAGGLTLIGTALGALVSALITNAVST